MISNLSLKLSILKSVIFKVEMVEKVEIWLSVSPGPYQPMSNTSSLHSTALHSDSISIIDLNNRTLLHVSMRTLTL